MHRHEARELYKEHEHRHCRNPGAKRHSQMCHLLGKLDELGSKPALTDAERELMTVTANGVKVIAAGWTPPAHARRP